MADWWKRWWKSLLKLVLAAAILIVVGRQFHDDLNRPELSQLELRPWWMLLSAVLYLTGLTCSMWFWRHLLGLLGPKPGFLMCLRAYYVGLMGKYVPGKALALVMRGTMVKPAGVRLGVGILTAFYEVITTMATGALIAAVLFLLHPPRISGLAWHPVWTGLILLGVLAVPLLPGVFNFMVRRTGRSFPGIVDQDLPPLRFGTLLQGMLAAAGGWVLLGLSVWTMLQAVVPEPPVLTVEHLAQVTAANALAYVAGFLAVFMPSGIGVREIFLLKLLAFAGPEPFVATAVLVLRLVWTAAELVLVAVLFWLPHHGAVQQRV